jgi:integrase/recombinase XerD
MSLLSVSDLASINRFVQTRRDRAATRNAYKAALRDFLRFVRAHADDDPFGTPLLGLWLKNSARHTTLKTVHTYARHVDRFLQWRQDCGEIPCNPFSELRRCYELRAVGPIVDALLVADYRGALEKLRPTPPFGSFLGPQMQAFVAMKRALGSRYRSEEKEFLQFDRFLQMRADLAGEPMHQLVEAYSQSKTGITAALRAHECGRRLSMALHRLDPAVPLLPVDRRLRRDTIERQRRPYVYSETQIRKLMEAARTFPSPQAPWRPLMLYTMVVLTYCAGLRIGELVRLTLADVYLDDDSIEIRESKFFKSRRLPLTPTVMQALKDYLAARDRAGAPHTAQSGLFWNHGLGRQYSYPAVSDNLANVIRRAGLKPPSGKVGPRVHDLRHSFVLHRMRDWYRRGINPQAMLPYLASYLGHKNISSTLSYLTQTQELKEIACERFRLSGAANAVSVAEVQP